MVWECGRCPLEPGFLLRSIDTDPWLSAKELLPIARKCGVALILISRRVMRKVAFSPRGLIGRS